ncbi:protein tyrosine kinase [Teladorsagia circumcincta]|uniref:Protein tyrosine kinase n=1 Tax=Teladorsagia circumcincta TaxID=45464 RepID=A0A2G9UNG9_TELCI|nr:protein tyrosine kinase [Teladorsagia circumcincta]
MPKGPDVPPPDAFDVSLLKQDYFHGLLPREDAAVLLTKHGDFLIRLSEVEGRSQEAREEVRELMAQCRLLNELYHPCVVQYYGVCLIAQPNCFLFELVTHGRLDEWLRAHQDTKRDERMLMAMSAGWGLEYLHQNSIIHREIAAKNCLYDRQFVKLSGFGKARKAVNYTMKAGRKMNVRWMAPESIDVFRFTQKSDVYGYGLLIYEIFAVREPYEGLSNTDARALILDGITPEFTGRMTRNLADVVKEKMWTFDGDKRANMRQVMMWMQLYTGMELQVVGGTGVKLSGFGKARKAANYTMKAGRKMNVRWMAPESIDVFRFTQKSDVYGYGLLIYEIFAVREPYEGLSNTDARALILDGITPEFTGRMTRNLADVVKEKMWTFDGDKRANMRQCVTATVHQKMDNILAKDVELQSLPNFREPGPMTPSRSKKRKKNDGRSPK